MTVYPKLDLFLNNLAYAAILEPHIADIAEAAGVSWTWPRTVAGGLVMEFKGHVAEHGEQRAREKMRQSISFLEKLTHNLADMPSDIETIRSVYRGYVRIQRAVDFANHVFSDPESFERHRTLIDDPADGAGIATADIPGIATYYESALREIKAERGIIRIPGFERISDLAGGFNPGRVTFILAESGFGKSNLSLNLALAASKRMAVGYMNLELSFEDVSKRIAVLRSGKTWRDLFKGEIAVNDMNEPTRHEFRISDGTEVHVSSLIAWARAFKRENPSFGLFVIDYDQKMELTTSRETPEWRAMQLAVRAIENEAKKLGVHVILVAQLNRDGEISSSHRSVFTAHTVLTFRMFEGRPIVENSIKHRHAKGPCGVNVQYDDKSCVVREMPEDIFFLGAEKKPQAEARKSATSGLVNKFDTLMGKRKDG